MRPLLFAIALLFGLTGPLSAQNAEIESTISGQFDAFRSNDFDRAFTYASPTIKGIFGNSENFGAMVSNGYPMVRNPAEVRYLELREVAGGLWQRVEVTGGDGSVHILDYQMVQTEDGWKINAVQLLDRPDVAV